MSPEHTKSVLKDHGVPCRALTRIGGPAHTIVMASIHDLLNRLERAEDSVLQSTFLAPCLPGGRIQVRIAGLVRTFEPRPRDFEGWGLFRPQDERTARLSEPADLPLIAEYLQHLPVLRARLAVPLRGRSWLAYPVNESDMAQRWGKPRPLAIHLVEDGARFDPVVARGEGGGVFWMDEVDRRAEPQFAAQLQEALDRVVPPHLVSFAGRTPEMRAAYELAAQHSPQFAPQRAAQDPEQRLRQALVVGGGRMQRHQDRGDHWLVEWTTRDGAHHTSAISKTDLTVLCSGICLSGHDREFDLQSLVGVFDQRPDWV